MPELPDITSYLEALAPRVLEQPLEKIRVVSISLLRSVDPPLSEFEGLPVRELRRIGKRIVFGFDEERFLVVHLMVAGRFRWRPKGAKPPGKRGHAAFDFPTGTLLLTEAATKKRTTLYAVRGEDALAEHDPGGVEPLTCELAEFAAALTRSNHTLKRALTDPRILSGIGNAYSDEILHKARMSPVKLTQRLEPDEIARLFEATRSTLTWWIEHFRRELGEDFPEKVTAFRPEMSTHGRYNEPCPVCQSPIQRIVHASNETNYCATCQTGGKLLADRALSRLLKKDWPRTLEEMERRRGS